MLKRLWQLRMIRIISGVFLLIIGILVGLLPGPGGFIFWLPGLIIILGDVPWMRTIVAFHLRLFRKIKFFRKLIRNSRIIIYKKTGWRFYFKKRKREEK